jgi:methyl-accepting chemotaxis protein
MRDHGIKQLQGKADMQNLYFKTGDALTGAFNRESFFERAAVELQAVFAQGGACCLAVMELNEFRDFSNQYGQRMGDTVLKYAVRIISANLRRTDFMGHYDGARFILFFAGADLETCREICGRLARNLAATPMALEMGMAYITASFGAAEAQRRNFSLVRGKLEGMDLVQKLAVRAERALGE